MVPHRESLRMGLNSSTETCCIGKIFQWIHGWMWDVIFLIRMFLTNHFGYYMQNSTISYMYRLYCISIIPVIV